MSGAYNLSSGRNYLPLPSTLRRSASTEPPQVYCLLRPGPCPVRTRSVTWKDDLVFVGVARLVSSFYVGRHSYSHSLTPKSYRGSMKRGTGGGSEEDCWNEGWTGGWGLRVKGPRGRKQGGGPDG